jgi:phosphoglycolate phosphatase
LDSFKSTASQFEHLAEERDTLFNNLSTQMKRAVLIFDLDGTLVDSVPDLRAALNEMLGAMHRRELRADEVRRMIGDGTWALVERALAATGTITDVDAAHQHFLQFYEAAPAKLSRLYPGVEATLKSLRVSGARFAVCTNKPQAATLRVLEGFGIAQYFDAVLGGDAVPFRKPDPRHLVAAIERLRATTKDAVMIGDNENDYAAARAAGIPVILMRYGCNPRPRALSLKRKLRVGRVAQCR